jgi:hypothetical protein
LVGCVAQVAIQGRNQSRPLKNCEIVLIQDVVVKRYYSDSLMRIDFIEYLFDITKVYHFAIYSSKHNRSANNWD